MNTITIPINLQLTISASGSAQQTVPEPTLRDTPNVIWRLNPAVGSYSVNSGQKTPPAPGEFWAEQGGYYICTLPAIQHLPARHLVVAQAEFENITFGPRKDIAGAKSHFDGVANTMALLAADENHPAAQEAIGYNCDGTSGWHLPSRLDMLMAYLYAPKLFKKEGWYWTSTHFSSNNAFMQDFHYGHSNWNLKDTAYKVRPVRVIHL